ncbi:arylsulfotransferase family protein [Frigidibacter sp. SD6-1]|uniref:arylsulfotransferase family protein n=1 Tax=Frigidibacter sp. SD6-1 TaxID=3032581 RepID=UPI0024DF32EB|nr:arylsulfotransferase family protein [Frigidibacter sp. SD6-1]
MASLSKLLFVVGLCFLTFVWGVVATTKQVFPYRYVQHVLTGIDAWKKMEKTRLPQHVIGPAPDASGPSPVRALATSGSDDLILMTGGFFERQDICPSFGCMAAIMDRSGKVLHSWQADPAILFATEKFADFTGQPDPLNMNVQGVDIDGDGNLIVVFQGRNIFPYQVGIAKFGWDGGLLWQRMDNSHHWPTVGPDGRIYVPISRIARDETHVAGTSEPLDCKGGAVFEEGVQILAPDGTELHRFWMADAVLASDMQGLAYSVRTDCDPYHVNGITLLTPVAAQKLPGTQAGDLVVSLRSSSSLVVMDAETGEIKHVTVGPMVAQHSPHVLPDGSFAVFDNLGSHDTPGGSRVLRLDPVTGRSETIFPIAENAAGWGLNSNAQGQISFSDDGTRMLVASTLEGLVYEVEVATGRALWEYRSISDMRPYLEMTGQSPGTDRFFRLQTQGARFVRAADYERFAARG